MSIALSRRMVLAVVRIFPEPHDQAAARALLASCLGKTRVHPGCSGCTLATEQDPESLLYVELWESEEHFKRRVESDDYGKILAAMELSTRKPEVVVYDVDSQQGLEFIEKIRLSPQAEGTDPNA